MARGKHTHQPHFQLPSHLLCMLLGHLCLDLVHYLPSRAALPLVPGLQFTEPACDHWAECMH